MKKILFTGGKGLLGKYFLRDIPKDYSVFATYLSNKLDGKGSKNFSYVSLDIGNKSEVSSVLKKFRPEIVVHAASLGNVDYCEKNKEEARRVNVEGTVNISEGSKNIGASLIFISSNAIFNGLKPPYSEKSRPLPIDYYGATKYEAEKELKKRHPKAVVCRLMTMYGWNNKGERLNPGTWILSQLKEEKQTKIVNDIYNNYLYAGDAARILWKIILKNKLGEVFNVAGSECINRYQFAQNVAKVFKLNEDLLIPVTSDYFKNIAPRPKNTCFNIHKVITSLKIKPLSTLKGLEEMRNEKN